MKILFFTESLRSGGKERRLVELIKGLKKYPDINCELVLTRKDIHYTDIFETEIKIHIIERKYLKKDPSLFFKFYRITKKFKPDIINVWGSMVAIYAIPTKVLLRIPMINNQITVAPLKVSGGLFSHHITFPFSDRLLANSYAGLKSYNAPKVKSSVIYNGFDFNRIANLNDKNTIREMFNIKTKYVVGMVASFSDLKDYRTYVSAANMILEKRNDVIFLCVGAGDDTPYKKMVLSKNKDKILFLGRQSNVENIMNVCDIGILTSNIEKHGEGISNALMEFSALGKPVIATDNGGTPEIIQNNKNGFLVEPFDFTKLADLIKFLLENEQIRIEMGINAKRVVNQKFSIEKMVKEYLMLYENLLN